MVEEGFQPWNLTLIGKFLGWSPSVDRVHQSPVAKWALDAEVEIIPINYGFFYFRFSNPKDRDSVLFGGPWIVDDSTLGLELWSASFVPSPDRLPRTTLWMRIPDLPNLCWTQSALERIASAAGRFVRMDGTTADLSKLRFAKVAVEVDTQKPLVPGTDLDFEGVEIFRSGSVSNMSIFTSFALLVVGLGIADLTVSLMLLIPLLNLILL